MSVSHISTSSHSQSLSLGIMFMSANLMSAVLWLRSCFWFCELGRDWRDEFKYIHILLVFFVCKGVVATGVALAPTDDVFKNIHVGAAK